METIIKSFGRVNGVDFDEIVIQKKDEFKISFSDLGARINSWLVPNEQGGWDNIVLGYNNAQHIFEEEGGNYGATMGRVAGRIADGEFELEGKKYTLPKNDGNNHLHGGNNSFNVKKWDYSIEENDDQVNLHFKFKDEAGTNGYPGNLIVHVTHTVTENNEWIISYQAKTDATTLFNPTNHVFFNLNGNVKETIKNHVIELKADKFIPVNEETLPLGEYASVEGTAFDLRQGQKFDDLLGRNDAQFNIDQGFDHPFILEEEDEYNGVIRLPEGNRQLFFKTEEPTVVIYTMNNPPEQTKIWGQDVETYSGITLETQKEPDAINHPEFSSIVLESNQIYESKTKYWLKNESEEVR